MQIIINSSFTTFFFTNKGHLDKIRALSGKLKNVKKVQKHDLHEKKTYRKNTFSKHLNLSSTYFKVQINRTRNLITEIDWGPQFSDELQH